MEGRTWILGLAIVLTGWCVSVSASAQNAAVRPADPFLRAADNSEGTYESAIVNNPEYKLRNVFQDVAIRDTLVYCLQGVACGDSCASLMILNIADPIKPTFVSRLRFHGGAHSGYNLKLHGDYVYLTVAAPGWTSIFYVIDVSDPVSPLIAGSYSFPAIATGIDVANDLAFLVDGVGSFGDTLNVVHILGVADPFQITLVKNVSTEYALDNVRIRGDYAYAVGWFDVYVIDISNPALAEVVSRTTTGLWPFDLDFGEDDSLAYVADIDDISPAYWSAFTVINVADPVQPKLVSQFPLFGAVLDVRAQGHWAIVSNGSCGVRVFDISDPASPVGVTRFEVPQFAGRMAIHDSLLILPDLATSQVGAEGLSCYPPTLGPGDPQPGDLLILSIADPANPTLLGFYSPTEQDPTGVDDVESDILPTTFVLYHNYPNPFNPATTIRYSLPEKARVSIDIYNLLGQSVIKLVDEEQSAGEHLALWDGLDQSGVAAASGVYFYRITAGNEVISKKMMLLK